MKTIVVKGTGRVSSKPDTVVLTLALDTRHAEYSKCMKNAAKEADILRQTLSNINFAVDALKTADFRIVAEYKRHKDTCGNYHEIFDVWSCCHDFKLEFPLDCERLSEVMAAIGKCEVHPKLKVRFSVADQREISEALLKSAVDNARRKAEILSAAAGVTLGEIIRIDYNWGELCLFSQTDYEDDLFADRVCYESVPMKIDPEEIQNSDTVTLVWEIA